MSRIHAYLILAIMPLFFSSNIVIGRSVSGIIEPWTLAFFRWSFASLIILPFAAPQIWKQRKHFIAHWPSFLTLGFLGMWISGAIVYLALDYTTAANGALIYTVSPVLIIIMEAIFSGRKINLREIIGITLAIFGVGIVVLKGDIQVLLSLTFNIGDLLFLCCAISWAIYSILLKKPAVSGLPNIVAFCGIALFGALSLLPFTIAEMFVTQSIPQGLNSWLAIFALATISSILPYGSYQLGVRVVGPAVTSIFMYLLPFYGIFLAIFFLGEILHWFHIMGGFFIVTGVSLATMPATIINKLLVRFQ